MILQKLKDTKKSFNNSKKKLDAYNVDTVPIHTSKERELYLGVFTSVLKFWNYKSCNFPKNQLGESQLKQMCKQHSTYHQFNLILQFNYNFFFNMMCNIEEKIIPDAAGRNTCCVQEGWWWVHKGNAVKEGKRLTLWHSDMKFWSSLTSITWEQIPWPLLIYY